MSEQNSHFYEFGPFRLDPVKRLLFRGDEMVKLAPKSFETLLALVEHHGRVLEKEELMKLLWPDSFVEEGNLTLNVSNLRKALGENPQQHEYIVTVPGRGYRFVARVKESAGVREESDAPQRTSDPLINVKEADAQEAARLIAPPAASRLTRPVLLACALLMLTALGYYFWSRRATTHAPPQQRLVSTFPGSHRAASFSPDGQMIAFVNTVDGAAQVWVKDLARGEPRQLTFGPDASERPRWSPRGDQIAYARLSRESSAVWSVPPQGGEPRKLVEGGRNPNWSWDGTRLVFERGYDIWTAKADGSDQEKVEGVPPTDLLLVDRMPAFSPDGALIAFFHSEGPVGDLWVIPTAGGQARRLTSDLTEGGAPAWTPDGRFVVFPSQRAGSMTLWRVPVTGGQPEPVLVSAGEDTDPEISRDGRKLIYTNTRNSYLIMLTDPATGQTKELRESHTELTAPSFSPRGDKILFFGYEGEDDDQIFTVNTDGGDFTQVTRVKGEHNIFPHWSADGSAIYFYQGPTNTFRKVSAHGGASSEVASDWHWITQFDAREDPEGRRIISSKLDRGRPVSTMIRDVATGRETAFTMPLMHSRWSADGRFIVGATLDEMLSKETPAKGEIMICPVDGDPCRELTRGFMPHWSGDDSRIYFQRVGNFEDGRELWSVSRDGGDERKVMDLRPLSFAPFYDVSPTGQVVWVQFRRGNSELRLSDFPNP